MEILTFALELLFYLVFAFGFLYLYFVMTPLTEDEKRRIEERSKEIISEREHKQANTSFPKPRNLGETQSDNKLFPKNPYLGQLIVNKEFGISITRIWDGSQWCIVKGEDK